MDGHQDGVSCVSPRRARYRRRVDIDTHTHHTSHILLDYLAVADIWICSRCECRWNIQVMSSEMSHVAIWESRRLLAHVTQRIPSETVYIGALLSTHRRQHPAFKYLTLNKTTRQLPCVCVCVACLFALRPEQSKHAVHCTQIALHTNCSAHKLKTYVRVPPPAA